MNISHFLRAWHRRFTVVAAVFLLVAAIPIHPQDASGVTLQNHRLAVQQVRPAA